MYIIFPILIGLLLLMAVVVCIVRRLSAKFASDGVETVCVESLSLVDVVSFFKKPDVIKKLQEDQNRIAVALKEKSDDGSVHILLCIYDKNSSSIVGEALKRFVARKLAADLKNVFGDKDMIVMT